MTTNKKNVKATTEQPHELSKSVIQQILAEIGCDDGHFGWKGCFGENKYFYIPSRVSKGFNPVISLGDFNLGVSYDVNGCKYICDGQEYEVLEFPIQQGKVEQTDGVFPLYPLNPINAVLTYHALKRMGFDGDVSIMTGLPFLEFYNEDGSINQELINAKKEALAARTIASHDNKQLPNIVSHGVMPEAAGALYDILLDWNGDIKEDVYDYQVVQPIMIVDIGGKTTDIATFQHMQVNMKCSTTIKHGALKITHEVSSLLKSHFRLNVEPHVNVVTKAIADKKYHDGEKEVSVADLVQPIINNFVDTLRSEIFKLASSANIGRIYFVGGGSVQFRKALEEMFTMGLHGAKPFFIDQPEFSNARGFYKTLVNSKKQA